MDPGSRYAALLQTHHVIDLDLYASQLSIGVHAGGVLQAIAFPFKTGPVGNGIAIWLGIQPADLFLYIFLPPMLVDAAVRIDFFIFRKVGQTPKFVKMHFGHLEECLITSTAYINARWSNA